jgi:hygromycin-B 7''-O-kinase
MQLPAEIDAAAFDALHDQPARWHAVVAAIAAGHSTGTVRPMSDGTVLVALVGDEFVIKLYPPFLRDHCSFERALLPRLHGRLGVPTPRLVAHGEREGWPWLLMTQLSGVSLTGPWPALSEARKCALLHAIGRLAAEVHALPVAEMAALAPAWPAFLQRQRAGCRQRQQRTGLPPHLLAQLDAFVAGPVPEGADVILTGEYTPMNLLLGPDGLSGLFDFGDGLIGPREYDWLGPLCFLAAGVGARRDAFFAGYGTPLAPDRRAGLLRLLLLHRYSHLPAQIACPGWQTAPDFETLAARIF